MFMPMTKPKESPMIPIAAIRTPWVQAAMPPPPARTPITEIAFFAVPSVLDKPEAEPMANPSNPVAMATNTVVPTNPKGSAILG